jgi:altronate hydrolase
MSTRQKILQVHPQDNVLVALVDLAKGETVQFNNNTYTLQENIPAKHKFFMQDHAAGR